MAIIDGNKQDQTFVSINNVALNRKDISSFSWKEEQLELQVLMISGYEHAFSFEDSAAFAEAVLKLNR